MSRIVAARIIVVKREGAGAIAVADAIARQHHRCKSELFPRPTITYWYQSTRGTRMPSTIVTIVSMTNRNDMLRTWHGKIQMMWKKVSVRMKDKAFYGKDSISVINFLTRFKQACNSSYIHKGAGVWLFRNFINHPALVAIKAPLILSLDDASRYEVTITAYA